MGLTPDGCALFKSLLAEQRANSVPYQLVNEIGYNKPIDKVVVNLKMFYFMNLTINIYLILNQKKQNWKFIWMKELKKKKKLLDLGKGCTQFSGKRRTL